MPSAESAAALLAIVVVVVGVVVVEGVDIGAVGGMLLSDAALVSAWPFAVPLGTVTSELNK